MSLINGKRKVLLAKAGGRCGRRQTFEVSATPNQNKEMNHRNLKKSILSTKGKNKRT